MLRKLDDFVIDGLLQKRVDAARERYDVTSYWVAETFAYVYVGVQLVDKFFIDKSTLTPILILFVLWTPLILLLRHYDRRVKETIVRTMSPFRAPPLLMFLRTLTIGFIAIDLLALLLIAIIAFAGAGDEEGNSLMVEFGLAAVKDVAICCVYYFAACSTKPRSPHTVTMPAGAVASTN